MKAILRVQQTKGQLYFCINKVWVGFVFVCLIFVFVFAFFVGNSYVINLVRDLCFSSKHWICFKMKRCVFHGPSLPLLITFSYSFFFAINNKNIISWLSDRKLRMFKDLQFFLNYLRYLRLDLERWWRILPGVLAVDLGYPQSVTHTSNPSWWWKHTCKQQTYTWPSKFYLVISNQHIFDKCHRSRFKKCLSASSSTVSGWNGLHQS